MIKLICVTPDNNNKFYNMEDLGDGTFKVEYGRIGSTSTIISFQISEWDKKYRDKIKKGYIDVSENLKDVIIKQALEIDNKDVKELINFLMGCAKQSLKTNYQIDISSINQVQIDAVQELLDEINDKLSLDDINKKLQKIYMTIPRKMANTRYYFLKDKVDSKFLNELIISEQNQLNTLKSQVSLTHIDSDKITLETLGFSCELASEDDRKYIKNNTDFNLTNHKVFKISNKETESRFNPKNIKTKLLYHGSRNENFLSILQTGLKIRPSGVVLTGSMFGNGIYAANKARKAIGYTSLKGSYWASGSSNKGYLALFEFATGKEYSVLDNSTWSNWMSKLTENEINKKGYDSVFARGGVDLRNDEYIVYNSNQVTVKYLIELTE